MAHWMEEKRWQFRVETWGEEPHRTVVNEHTDLKHWKMDRTCVMHMARALLAMGLAIVSPKKTVPLWALEPSNQRPGRQTAPARGASLPCLDLKRIV